MADYILLFGPPGAGKGSQAQLLGESLKLPHVATGDLFRDILKQETPLGVLAKGYMSRGELVPDEVTIAMLKERLDRPDAARGALLDGFPRTEAQAAALSELLAERGGRIRAVLFISAPEEVLLERLTGRWTCGRCGAIYNATTNPTRAPGVCDRCGSPVEQRTDDSPDVQRRRIRVYLEQTLPLVEYYRRQGQLVEIDGRQSLQEVHREILEAIDRSSRAAP